MTAGPPASAAAAPSAASDRELRNLEAFARLYGWVRWFHPSEEASAVDWDRFAVLGVERVRGAADDTALRAALDELFRPLAPTVQVFAAGEPEPAAAPAPPPPAERWQTIAWQHRGLGQGSPPYASARLHRPRVEPRGGMSARFATVTQGVPAAPLRGKRVRLRVAMRAEVEGAGNQAQAWLRVDRPNRAMGFFDNMGDRPVRSPEWAVYEIVGDVAADAETVAFGSFLSGSGSVWVDDVELAVEEGGAWRPLAIENPGFEAGAEPTGWRAAAPGYAYEIAREGAHGGAAALRIRDDSVTIAEPLFAAAPAAGETHRGELVPGLLARVPLALPGDAETTWPPAPAAELAALQAALAAVGPAPWTGDDWRVRAAAATIAWNVFQHFYPYLDVVPVDWPAELPKVLRGALAAADARAFEVTLKELVAAARDGHGNVGAAALHTGRAGLPVALVVVEGKVVVAAAEEGGALRRGDVLVALDGQPVADLLEAAARLRSGTPQWRRHSALWRIGEGPEGEPANVRVERDGATLDVVVPRGAAPEPQPALEPAATLPGGVLYLDLRRLDAAALEAGLQRLGAARAAVFDLRGYPQGGAQAALQRLTDQTLQSAIWKVPEIVRPGGGAPASWETGGRWELPPVAPRFTGKVAFLTDEGAISYAESILGIVEAYRLGEIVGATTAGTNGNINRVSLPGGYLVIFTGMRVLKHDGSEHHLVGIRPTVPAEPTLAGFRAGRDEVLEAALRALGAAPGG